MYLTRGKAVQFLRTLIRGQAGRIQADFFFKCSGVHGDLHSFPTRRSSDLEVVLDAPGERVRARGRDADRHQGARHQPLRSEEHTSELQSRQYLVCRLLLEKKNAKAVLRVWSTAWLFCQVLGCQREGDRQRY